MNNEYECRYIFGIKTIPYNYDPFESKVKYLKSINISLNYGASNNFPISIGHPKGFDLNKLKLLGIDCTTIPRNKWFEF